MKRVLVTLICGMLLTEACLLAQTATADKQSSADLAKAAMRHIAKLASLGCREAGSSAEASALAYIDGEFRSMGFVTSSEDFTFSTYSLQEMQLRFGDARLVPEHVVFDPYAGAKVISGPAACIAPHLPRQEIFKLDLTGKIAITAKPVNRFDLALRKPRAVVYLKAEDFARFQESACTSAELRTIGKTIKKHSANLITAIPASFAPSRRILVSAHYDSMSGPGASDNASGIALMLEIARHFQQQLSLPGLHLEFAALGAEEVGMLGAKTYVMRHADILNQYELVFNIDTAGGDGEIYIEMRAGVQGVSSRRGVSQIPPGLADKAVTDGSGLWGWLRPELMTTVIASCVPEWLQKEITDAAADLGISIQPSNFMGSDHLIFAQAGIPATDIAAAGGAIHSPDDTPEKISRNNLEKVAGLVIRVIEKTMADRATKKRIPGNFTALRTGLR